MVANPLSIASSFMLLAPLSSDLSFPGKRATFRDLRRYRSRSLSLDVTRLRVTISFVPSTMPSIPTWISPFLNYVGESTTWRLYVVTIGSDASRCRRADRFHGRKMTKASRSCSLLKHPSLGIHKSTRCQHASPMSAFTLRVSR